MKKTNYERKLFKLREKWLEQVKLKDKKDKLFELEVWLKGLDRFFNLENLPLNSEENPIRINFIDELAIAQQGFSRVIELSRRFLEANEKSYYQFRYYVESELLGDLARSQMLEQSLAQKSPEESLMLLYASFLSLKHLAQELLKLKEIGYPLFFHFGALTTRAIVRNKFFNPIKGIWFRPEYDRVPNPLVSRAVRGLLSSELRRRISLVILSFYRLLHYLDFIELQTEEPELLKPSLIIFALINSEARHLIRYLEKEFKKELSPSQEKLVEEFIQLADMLGFQLGMELKKIRDSELAGVSKEANLDRLKTGIENSKGILVNFLQQSIVQLTQTLMPRVKGEEIFPDFISRKKQSLQLREDLAVLHSLMNKFEEITETTEAGASPQTFKTYLFLQQKYVRYMEENTVPLIRYGDLVEFRRYFKKLFSLKPSDLEQKEKLEEFKMESKFFKIFLETTLGHINQRADLQNLPPDRKKVEARLKDFINQQLKSSRGENGLGEIKAGA